MTHTIQHSLFIFYYNEAVIESRNNVLYNTIVSQAAILKEKGIKGIYVSLKNAPFSPLSKDNAQLQNLIKVLDKLSQALHLPVALGDYRKDQFEYLKRVSAETTVRLFQNLNIALLFFNPASLKKELSVLLYDEDTVMVEKLAAELAKLGYSVVHAKDVEDFKLKSSAKKYDITITYTVINQTETAQKPSIGLSLSKQLILNLPVFMDTAVNSLVTITGLEAQKIKHEIRPFNDKLTVQPIIAAMKFKGDVSGIFFLIFPRELAATALEAMLGEPVDKDDTAAIIDGVAELCNIITGASKAIFSNKDIKVLFELPKTYVSLQVALNDTTGNTGIWIDMQLNDKPFYMFITK